MGRILEIKNIKGGKVVANIELTQDEYKHLKGSIDDLIVFAGENLSEDSRLVQRGRKESTKYFLLPRKLRDGIDTCNDVKCDRIENGSKSVFIFEMNKQK